MTTALKKTVTIKGGITLTDALHKIVNVQGEDTRITFKVATFVDQAALDANDAVKEEFVNVDMSEGSRDGLLDVLYALLAAHMGAEPLP